MLLTGILGEVEVLFVESLIDVESMSELLDDTLVADEGIVDECERLNLSDSNLYLIKHSTTECVRLLVISLSGSRISSNLSRLLFLFSCSRIFL